MSPDAFGNLLVIFGVLCGAACLVLFAVSLVWGYRDAEAPDLIGYHASGCGWSGSLPQLR